MLNKIALIFVLSAFAFGQSQPSSSCASREIVKADTGIQVWRLTVAAHASSQAFTHGRDYVFVPLNNLEVMQSVRPGTERNPLADGSRSAVRTSWVPRNSDIEFVHPRETEPKTGEVIYNPNDTSYTALEIVVDEGLPTLNLRVSLFSGSNETSRTWRIGKFLLNVQPLKSGGQIKDLGVEKTLFSMSAMTLGVGPEHNRLTIQAGQPIELNASGHYCNITTVDTSILLLSRLSPEELLPVLGMLEGPRD